MKATWDIPKETLDNVKDFQNDFYKRFTLRKAPQPLQLSADISKDYLFPTFYGDVSCAMAIFMCSYDKAASLLARQLSPQIVPVRMPRGRSLVAFSCYEYKKVLGVRPYNEIAIAIPVMVNPSCNVPVLPMIINSFSRFGYYIAGMPVTSKENTIRGRKIWGLPKLTQEIDIRKDAGECMVTTMDEKGDVYLSLRIPTNGVPTDFDVSSYLYTQLGGRLLQNRTDFKAAFNVKKNMPLLWRKDVQPDRPFIQLGDSSFAPMLKELEIEATPFQTRYAENVSSCFDLPGDQLPFWAKDLQVSNHTLPPEREL
jgi:hypothetical protein